MEHLEVKAKCTGDVITAIGNCIKLSQVYEKNIELSFYDGATITVRPNSNVHDLYEILKLKTREINNQR